ncbi:helix-turn-helix domain-containing protein [Enterobacter asburiae]|uniref:helix-turn-helix domain-containing protein n=1 Tax=Enterobacter asburiae TaxID=61645 RepID=UPI003EE4B5CD
MTTKEYMAAILHRKLIMEMKYNVDALQKLTDTLFMSHAHHVIYAAPKQKLSFKDESCSYVYILTKGMVDIRRNSDGVIVFTTKGKALLGLESIFTGLYFHHLTCVTESQIIAIDRLAALDLFNAKNSWQAVSVILSQAAEYHYRRDSMVSCCTTYDIIRNHLEMIWSYPEEDRVNISVFDFILNRTRISRSSLNKVLKDLTLGGYIYLRRGRLINVVKIPKSY